MGLALILPFTAFNILYFKPLYDPVGIEAPASVDALVDQLELNLDGLLATNTIPGAAIAIISDNQSHLFTGGKSDMLSGQDITPEHLFQIASMSKTQCAFAIMKLVQDGLISLDAPIEWYLTRWTIPQSEFNTSGVTVRRILCHASGISLEGVSGELSPTNLPSIEEALETSNVHLIYEPGTTFSYSGGAFGVLQLLIEEVTGMSYDEYLMTNILTPLGLTNTLTCLNGETDKLLTVGHTNMMLPTVRTYPAIKAAAAHYSSLEDMTKWVNHLLNGQSLINTSNMIDMYTPQWGESWGWTLGFNYKILSNGVLTLGHGGDNWGYRVVYRFAPQTGDALIVLTNGDRGAALVEELVQYWEHIVGDEPINDIWQSSRIFYLQVQFYEMLFSIVIIVAFGILWKKRSLLSSRLKVGHSRLIRLVVATLCIVIAVGLLIYWGYTPLSPISFGSNTYHWAIMLPVLWLFGLSALVQSSMLSKSRIQT